ncbi:MAG: large conductance mechanosensitive channel protein MscL [Gemmatimonadaceae bacterium]
MWKEFRAFLIKQNAVALAVAVVIGTALNKVVTAVVEDIIMPIVAYASPGGEWQRTTWDVGPIRFKVGDLASAIVSFFIIGFVAWRLAKLVIRQEDAKPAAATKPCPYCKMPVDAAATRCQHCTSAL